MTFEDHLIRQARKEAAEEYRTDSPTPLAVAYRILVNDTALPIIALFPSVAEGEDTRNPQ